jgi:DNA-binding PadR family transcriptional regulator
MFKGHLKLLVLKALDKEPESGYNLMKSLAEMAGKRPSPGSIYPLLDDLHKQGMVSVRASGRRKIYSLTKKGKSTEQDALKTKDDLQKMLIQTMNVFAGMVDDRELAQIRSMLSGLNKEQDVEKFTAFKKEMLPLKIRLFEILDRGDKEKIAKTLKILADTNSRLKKI